MTPASALVSFKDEKGEFLPAGSEIWVNESSTPFSIGYDGEAYLQGLSPSNIALIKYPDGKPCNAEFDFKPDPNGQVRLADIVCKSAKTLNIATKTGGITIQAKR